MEYLFLFSKCILRVIARQDMRENTKARRYRKRVKIDLKISGGVLDLCKIYSLMPRSVVRRSEHRREFSRPSETLLPAAWLRFFRHPLGRRTCREMYMVPVALELSCTRKLRRNRSKHPAFFGNVRSGVRRLQHHCRRKGLPRAHAVESHADDKAHTVDVRR